MKLTPSLIDFFAVFSKKNQFIFLFLLSNIGHLHAQNEQLFLHEIKEKKTPKTKQTEQIQKIVNVDLDSLSHAIVTEEIVVETPKVDYIKEDWDTRRFNPYKYQKVSYPFQIQFSDSTFAAPINRPRVVTSHYGWRNGRAHKGTDIDLITGDLVKAILPGKVRYVKYHYGHGKTVIIRHYNGLETVYAHLSRQFVRENDSVKKGQLIGRGGVTGNARGSHLHFEVRYKGICINPEYFFDFENDSKIRSQNVWVTNKWTSPHLYSSRKDPEIHICETFEEAQKYQAEKIVMYTVKRGDTLSDISRKYQVSIAALCKANAIRRNTILKVGQQIRLGD